MRISYTLQSWLMAIVARLPFWVVYLFSDGFTLLAEYVIPYRRQLVFQNISDTFPEKSPHEIRRIRRKFYRQFIDVMFEVFKMPGIGMKELQKRMVITNTELLKELDAKGRSVILAGGHFANWEWLGNRVKPETDHVGVALYKEIHNSFYNDYMMKVRSLYEKTLLVEHEKTSRALVRLRNSKVLLLVLSDQRPSAHDLKYWIPFLGRETPVLPGIEKIANAFDFDVLYFDICRIKRGYYKATLVPLKTGDEKLSELELTKRYFNQIEKSVYRQPESYLWTHNRWKYKREN